MKYWFGYLTAAIFGAITWVLMRFGERFSTLVDMVYPYVIRTSESILAQWASGVDFPIWQLLAVALGALILASIVLMIVLKWNPIQWGGWVLAFFAGIYMLHTMFWGLNYYSGPLSDDMRLDVGSYNLEELTEATEYYRDKANALALQVNRDGSGNVAFADFDALAGKADVVAADGFVGNVLLKNTEGVISMIFGLIKGGLMDSTKGKLAALLAKDTFRGIKRSFDSTEIGGAPLLGVEGAVIKAHGNSNARAIFCAIRQAKSMVDGGVVDVIRDEVAKLSVGEEQA